MEHKSSQDKNLDNESGVILVALLAAVLPLVVLVVASSTTMTSRNKGLQYDIMQTKALMAAEAGVDDAIFRSTNGNLNSGQSFSRVLPNGATYKVEPLHLQSDGKDNDGDGSTDEQDENIFELIVTGTFGTGKRRLAAYLGPVGDLPHIDGAITVSNPNAEIDIAQRTGHDPLVTGMDYKMDGTPVGPVIAGLCIESPGTVAHLESELSSYEAPRIEGDGGPPSLKAVDNGYDFDAIAEQARNSANMVLTTRTYHDVDWGNSEEGRYNIIFREGQLEVFGGRGAGILVATGEIELEDGFRWDGLIISTHGKELELESDANKGKVVVYGAMVVGPACEELELEGNVAVYYCSEVLNYLNLLVPSSRYIGFNGWQEISIYETATAPVVVPPSIGNNADIDPSVTFGTNCVIGNNATIQAGCAFGDYVELGNGAQIDLGCSFGNNITAGNNLQMGKSIVVGNNVTIGNNVQIGNDVQIGAGATVTSDVPPGTVIPPGTTY